MNKQEYIKKAEEIVIASHDCAEWGCWDHTKEAQALYQLHLEGVREIIGEDEEDQVALHKVGKGKYEGSYDFSKAERNKLRAEQREKLKK